MSEQLIANIELYEENLSNLDSGGAFRQVNLDITVDSTIPKERQMDAVIYEILAAYLGASIDRAHLEEISANITETLLQLEEF